MTVSHPRGSSSHSDLRFAPLDILHTLTDSTSTSCRLFIEMSIFEI